MQQTRAIKGHCRGRCRGKIIANLAIFVERLFEQTALLVGLADQKAGAPLKIAKASLFEQFDIGLERLFFFAQCIERAPAVQPGPVFLVRIRIGLQDIAKGLQSVAKPGLVLQGHLRLG